MYFSLMELKLLMEFSVSLAGILVQLFLSRIVDIHSLAALNGIQYGKREVTNYLF